MIRDDYYLVVSSPTWNHDVFLGVLPKKGIAFRLTNVRGYVRIFPSHSSSKRVETCGVNFYILTTVASLSTFRDICCKVWRNTGESHGWNRFIRAEGVRVDKPDRQTAPPGKEFSPRASWVSQIF